VVVVDAMRCHAMPPSQYQSARERDDISHIYLKTGAQGTFTAPSPLSAEQKKNIFVTSVSLTYLVVSKKDVKISKSPLGVKRKKWVGLKGMSKNRKLLSPPLISSTENLLVR